MLVMFLFDPWKNFYQEWFDTTPPPNYGIGELFLQKKDVIKNSRNPHVSKHLR